MIKHDRPKGQVWNPSPDEIAEETSQIQASWTDPELRARLGLPRHRAATEADDAYLVPWSVPIFEDPSDAA
jgi:hypothetical protein